MEALAMLKGVHKTFWGSFYMVGDVEARLKGVQQVSTL